MKIYLIVNPFNNNASHGIHNYIVNLIDELKSLQIPYDYIYNNKLSLNDYRQYVYDYVHQNYGYDEVIIEAPEARAATLYLEKNYNIHIRLHTPGAIAQKYDGKLINQDEYSNEQRVINKAKIVSSPSYGLLKELKSELNLNHVSVYKNPYNKSISCSKNKKYDLVFLGRFQPLKGIEYINPILEKLPKHFKVLLIGNNSHTLKLDKNIQCDVQFYEHISDTTRFDLIAESKSLMLLSKFENCSMVILEALACNTIVNAWDVGGNSEIADDSVLKIIPFEDTLSMANQIIVNTIEPYPDSSLFQKALTYISNDFHEGLFSVITSFNQKQINTFNGLNFTSSHSPKEILIEKDRKEYRKEDFGNRIFGFSISNEHIEEMWMPIIKKFESEYLFVSKREKGFHSCFTHSYHVDDNRYLVYDWVKEPKRLIADIKKFEPNKIFFHNGLHPSYQKALKLIKDNIDVPIVYSELGWFPQLNHVYFDEYGTNGKSKIASQNFKEFTGKEIPQIKQTSGNDNKHILIITQTENDTNLIVNSKRFKKNIPFIKYVLDQLSLVGENQNIIIKTHPLDSNRKLMEEFISKGVNVIHDGDLTKLLSESKAIIGINSTVLMEALKYDCNIYMFGESLLNNKSVVIDCRSKELSEVWTNELISSIKAKDIIIQEFINRQIDLEKIDEQSLSSCLKSKAFRPLLSNKKLYDNKEILLSLPKQTIGKKRKNIINKYEKKVYERKICKFFFHTKAFFRDGKNPIVIFIWKFYSKVFEI